MFLVYLVGWLLTFILLVFSDDWTLLLLSLINLLFILLMVKDAKQARLVKKKPAKKKN